ncbi:MAG: ribonuclease P protein component [Myxococcales bacterium]|nr:ribonuclease P protein component [Myxococcales bacterium]
MSAPLAFPKTRRLLSRRDFLRVQRRGARAKGNGLVLIAMPGQHEQGRAGLVVSKKVGKAHLRNLIKRRLRHILRENKNTFARRDLVVMALPQIADHSFEDLKKDFFHTVSALNQNIQRRKKKRQTNG